MTEQEKILKPLPCPFCGAEFRWEGRYYRTKAGDSTGAWACRHRPSCHFEGERTCFHLELSDDGIPFTEGYQAVKKHLFEARIQRWNTRTKEEDKNA